MPFVNGVYFDSPGAQVNINDQNFQATPTGNGLGALLIGPAVDGEPNTALSITSPAQAISTLKGGDLLQGALNAFAGADKVNGTLTLTVIRPEIATQATSTINSSTATATVPLTTTSYGTVANSSKWMIQTASGGVGYMVSQATDFVGPGGQTYPSSTKDNVFLPVITLAYTGAGTSPSYTVTDSLFSVSAGGVTIASVTLSSTVTVQQLVNQLNGVSTLTATVADPNPNDITGALFDNASNVALTSTATTVYANVTAVVRLFTSLDLYFTAVRNAGATNLATSNSWTYASGGTTPTATNANWQNAYTTAQSQTGISLIAPMIASYSIWAMNDTHCHYMASIGQPRRGYVGDALAQTLATETAQAIVLNSNRTSIVWPEQAGTTYNGASTTFAPYLVAASVLGERAATVAFNALTQQAVPSSGMGQAVTPGMVATGLAGGVCVLAPNSSGIVVVQQDRTTWLQNTAYDKVENSTGLVADIITQDLSQTLSAFVGKPVSAFTVAQATSAVFTRLNYWYAQRFIASQPALSDVALTGSGDTITGTAQAALDVPANYISLQLYPTALGSAA